MRLSAIIPTRGRPAQLAACVAALARQRPIDLEVLVAIDGEDDHASRDAATSAWLAAAGRPDRLRVLTLPRLGPGAARNALALVARAPVAWLLNDDVVPHPDAAQAHLAAHAFAAGESLVVGAAPWRVHPDDACFDRLIRETSMVFFYDRMTGKPAGHDWGFRHAWSLNLSLPTDLLRRVRFRVMPGTYGYDDLEFAFRAARPVRFAPDAVVLHDHRLSPRDYLAREHALGRAAAAYARAAPDFSAALFRRDILDPAHLASLEAAPRQSDADLAWFLGLATRPAADADPDAMIARHLPLKRRAWAEGLLAAAATPSIPVEPVYAQAP